jgi:hypothetical protein
MRTFMLILTLLFFPFIGFGQSETKHLLETDVNGATVYLTGAELRRTAQVGLKKGNNLLVFKGLSPYVNAKSIRISGDIDLSVLSISTKQLPN